MWESIVEIFREDPAGWVSVVIAILLVVFSAVFWRRTAVVLRVIWRVISWPFRMLARIRITTVDKVKPKSREPVIRPRWLVVLGDARQGEYFLGNAVEGSVAEEVTLESLNPDARILSNTHWPAVPGERKVPFRMKVDRSATFMGVTFVVEWTDSRGERHRDSFTEDLWRDMIL